MHFMMLFCVTTLDGLMRRALVTPPHDLEYVL